VALSSSEMPQPQTVPVPNMFCSFINLQHGLYCLQFQEKKRRVPSLHAKTSKAFH